MKHVIISIVCLGGCLFGRTQDAQTIEKPYFFDEFKLGTVFFSNGEHSKALLNYSFVSQEMQFLDHQNNNAILNLVRRPDLTHIEIGKDVFVPVSNGGYAHVIMDGNIFLLYSKKTVIESRKSGGYNTTNSTSAVDNFSGIFGTGYMCEFPPNTQIRIVKSFYLMKDKKIYPATRRNYLRLYSEIKPQLEKFLQENKVDFKNEEHLRGLSKFCNSLMMAK